MTRNGVDASSNLAYNGGQVVIGDNLYFVVLSGGESYSDRNIAYLMRLNLRAVGGTVTVNEDLEIIPFPVPWGTDYDNPNTFVDANTSDHSQLRDIQALGHLVVLGPQGNEYVADRDPWCCWYDTNRKKWTVGKTYDQMRADDASLPATAYSPLTIRNPDTSAGASEYLEQNPIRPGPRVSRGMMCCVPETGEMWYFTGGDPVGGDNSRQGIVKYRILG
jgi:hypothetical protein